MNIGYLKNNYKDKEPFFKKNKLPYSLYTSCKYLNKYYYYHIIHKNYSNHSKDQEYVGF